MDTRIIGLKSPDFEYVIIHQDVGVDIYGTVVVAYQCESYFDNKEDAIKYLEESKSAYDINVLYRRVE